jgi:Holliday junction resolvase
MKRRLTRRENIGYQGEKKAVEILRKEGYIVESWLHSELKVGQEPYDIAARKGLARYLIDVKSSTSDKRKLPIHDHSLVDLINAAKKRRKTPMILVVKPTSYSFINPYDLLSAARPKDVYLYYCKLRNQKRKDIKGLLESRT